MPDKNVADSLQRLPGVTISSAGATEGGFDENDRVSMRGTNPSLTLTQINGHPVSSGDWFVLNQSDNAGRSVSYTLLPSSLVSQVVVQQDLAGQADRRRRHRQRRHHHPQAAGFRQALYRQRVDRRCVRGPARQDRLAVQRAVERAQRSLDRRRDAAGVLRRPQPAPRRRRSAGLRPVRCRDMATCRASGTRARSVRHYSNRSASAAAACWKCSSSPAMISPSTCPASSPSWMPPTTTATTCCSVRASSTRPTFRPAT